MSVGGLENVDVDSEEYHLGVSVVKGAVDSVRVLPHLNRA